VEPVVVRREQGVGVRPEAEEGDIAEIEQPREADHDVEAEREENVQEGVQAVREQIALVHPVGKRRRHPDEEEQLHRGRRGVPAAPQGSGPTALASPLRLRHPGVDADPGFRGRVGTIGGCRCL
jgi:hypothetical protein